MYLAYYGRPADVAGLQYWTKRLEHDRGDISVMINEFGASAEGRKLYQDLDVKTMIKVIYNRLFDRDPDTAGLDWWHTEIQSGRTSLVQASADIFWGAQPGSHDYQLLEARLHAAQQFTDSLKNDPELGNWYHGNEAGNQVMSWLQTVRSMDTITDFVFVQHKFEIKASAPVRLFEQHGDNWLGDIFAVDLNADGIDEIILAGRKSQSSPWPDWQNSLVQILGWNNGGFTNETAQWLGDRNSILGTEPSVHFGDFNNDGWTDVWIAPSTDSRVYGPGVVLTNINGQKLERQDIDIGEIWAHGSAVADINSDGFDNIVIASFGPDQTVILGGTDKLLVISSRQDIWAADIVVGDFLNDNTLTYVTTDSHIDPERDTVLHQLYVTDNQVDFREISTLPPERFYLPEWQQHLDIADYTAQRPHSIRLIAHDFNHDGDQDIIVITSANNKNNQWHAHFELQFLENRGNGRFVDVTDTTLRGFDVSTNVSYNPRLVDVNDDGLMDIWLSAQDYLGAENSNRVIWARPDGTYIDGLTHELGELRSELGGNPAPIIVARGPDNALDLVTMTWTDQSPWAEVAVIGADPSLFVYP